MRLVKSIDDYNNLLKQAKSKAKLRFTNCLFMKDDIIDLTDSKSLFYKNIDNGILFFKKERGMAYLYYFLNSIENIDLSHIDGNIMIELVDRKKLNRTSSHVEGWERNAFVKYCVNEEMTITLSQEKEYPYNEDKEYSIGFGTLEEIAAIKKLWKTSLDKISMPLPGEKDLGKLIEDKEIVTIVDKEKNLVGALQASINNGRCLLSHIVVD